MTKTVLLYGDSIFWGLNGTTRARHEKADRINSVIQAELGNEVEIISEGHRGRTLFGENGFFPQRDGLAQFGPIFASHLPIDVVVIMLGVNDLNTKTDHSPEELGAALKDYEAEAKIWCDFMQYTLPKFVIISPLDILEETFTDFQREIFEGAAAKIDTVAKTLQQSATERGWSYLDPRSVARPINSDGIHLDVSESRKLALAMTRQLSDLLT